MKTFGKRMASVLLALCMVFSFAPGLAGPAYAEDPVLPFAPYTTWDNALVVPVDTQITFTPDTGNSNINDPQIWVAVNVPEDYQAIKYSFVNAKVELDVRTYDGNLLEAGDGKVEDSMRIATLFPSGTFTELVRTPHAGTYYIMIKPHYSNSTSDVMAGVTFSLVGGDLNEPNNTAETATELTENVSTYFTLNGFNDVDWFKITTTIPGESIKLYFSNIDYTVPTLRAYLYAEGNLNSDVWYMDASQNCASAYKVNTPGTYYLKVNTYYNDNYCEKAVRLRCELLPPDEYELNDSWDSAVFIPYDFPMEFTITGTNDRDWFYFDTATPGEIVTLQLSGFNTDYSNKITYYIWDAAVDPITNEFTGTSTQRYYSDGVNITHSRQMSFATTGRHYIRISPYNSTITENPLKIILASQVDADDQEPNNTRDLATQLYENIPTTFNLPLGDTDWFKFTTEEPDQTLELTTTLPAGGTANIYLYSGADFELSGDSASHWTYFTPGSGMRTYRYMLRDAGDYYLRVNPYSSSTVFDNDATIVYNLINPDENERNNGYKTAATLNEGVAQVFNLPANNDTDWFKIIVSEPNETLQIDLTIPAGGSVYTYLYAGADFESTGDNAGHWTYWTPGSGPSTLRYMLGDAGEYYLRINPYNSNSIFDEDATVTYTLVHPDAHERNNSWKTPTTLNEGIATVFTLPAYNDSDWFHFVATEDNQTVQINTTLPTGKQIYVYLYSGKKFEESGDSASSMNYWTIGDGKRYLRWMLDEAGDYYFRITSYNGSNIFDEDATVSFDLIQPDGNERNNSWNTATELERRTLMNFSLPANNDYDWIHIGECTSGDILTWSLGNIPSVDANVEVHLYKKGEFDTDVSGVMYWYNSAGTYSYTIQSNNDFYLRISTWGSNYNKLFKNPVAWFKYNVVAADMPVTGIKDITNSDITIFKTKDVQLYANIEPYNATNQEVTWTSSDPAIATIDENGVVTGVEVGDVIITATTKDGGFTKSVPMSVAEVVPVTGVEINAAEAGANPSHHGYDELDPYFLALDTSLALSGKVVPSGATEQEITWTVSDPDVLAVNQYGRVYAVGGGAAYAIATSADGGYTANFYFNVPSEANYAVRSISLNYKVCTMYLTEGDLQLEATVFPEYATNPAVIWFSDNEAVATVDENGLVKSVSKGYATITCRAAENASIQATCFITVQPARIRVTGLSFEEELVDMKIYSTLQLVPTFAPADATIKELTWESMNKNVATVSRTGLVSALNLGTATIKATSKDGGFSAYIDIRVTANAELGDLSEDGSIDAADALIILRYSVGLMALSEAQKSVADVNGDGDIDAGDAILILRYDAGLISEFPAKP
ncbi:MAG: Ig-like domain-containing protein [Clostridia bacterium]|nr:Ig-like domain-containing protein [Clostridia bacterium]